MINYSGIENFLRFIIESVLVACQFRAESLRTVYGTDFAEGLRRDDITEPDQIT